MDEFELIERLLALAGAPVRGVRLGPGDDACVLRPPRGRDLVLTTDVQVEGVHFRWDRVTPADVGHRAAAACLSDLAAMGARPWVVLSSLAVPLSMTVGRVEGVQRGLHHALRRYGAALVGGNVSRAPRHYSITLTALGTVPPDSHLTRSGSAPGQTIWVSGKPGRAALGRECLFRGLAAPAFERAYRRPEPRIELGWALRRRGLATAMIDVSDGVAGDLGHLLGPEMGARLDESALLPDRSFARLAGGLGLDPRKLALHGGEDYELLFTVRPGVQERSLERLGMRLGTAVRRIGVVEAKPGIRVADRRGRLHAVASRGFRHTVATRRDAVRRG